LKLALDLAGGFERRTRRQVFVTGKITELDVDPTYAVTAQRFIKEIRCVAALGDRALRREYYRFINNIASKLRRLTD